MSQTAAFSRPATQQEPHLAPPSAAHGPPPVEQLLMETLALVRDDWARDFMFKMDPAADVSALTSPVQLRYGMVVDTVSSMFETDEAYGGMFDVNMACRWLIVPVFTVNDLSCDVIVQSSSSESESNFRFCVARLETTIIRMIRSNSTGSLLLFVNDHGADSITVWLFHGPTSGSRRRVFLKAKRSAFIDAVLDPHGRDYSRLSQSLEMASVTRESLSPQPPPSMPNFGFKRPLHPLDFATSRQNLLCHGGLFAGSCNINLLTNGVTFATGALGSTVNITPCNELGAGRRMAEAGIQHIMRTRAAVQRTVPCATPRPAPNSVGIAGIGASFAEAGAFSPDFIDMPFDPFNISGDAALLNNFTAPPSLLSGATGPHDSRGLLLPPRNPLQIEPLAPRRRRAAPDREAAERKRMRTLRNREAAARSNLRRKERNDALKENVLVIRKRKQELEEREAELRQENANLRRLVGADAARVSLRSPQLHSPGCR